MRVRGAYGFYEVPEPGTKGAVILGPKDELEVVTVLGRPRTDSFRYEGPNGSYVEHYRATMRLVLVRDAGGLKRKLAVERFPLAED